MGAWTLAYDGYAPASEGLREALCTLGNGYMATRGATPDGEARGAGTYVAGCYDRLSSTVAGREVSNEDIVNMPDWLPLTFRTPGCAWFSPTGPICWTTGRNSTCGTGCCTGRCATATSGAG
ncbi:hypothetical protein [Thermocatellispora tengchongensis]|uniref:hypothetical protein n=1 Tax=Thermocatellispora tengchongensis TaxID=1073253 RepID=UPI003626A005